MPFLSSSTTFKIEEHANLLLVYDGVLERFLAVYNLNYLFIYHSNCLSRCNSYLLLEIMSQTEKFKSNLISVN